MHIRPINLQLDLYTVLISFIDEIARIHSYHYLGWLLYSVWTIDKNIKDMRVYRKITSMPINGQSMVFFL